MAIIGELTTNGNFLQGTLRTLTVNTKIRLISIERVSRDAPDYRVVAPNGAELGAGWKAVSTNGEPYISLKIDDPSFNAPISTAAWPDEKEGDYALVWNRPVREAA